MRKNFGLLAGAALLICSASCFADQTTNAQKPASQEAQQDMSAISQAFGHFIGRNLNVPGIKFDAESLIQGIRDGMAGKPAPMSDADYEKAMTDLQEQAFRALSKDNLSEAVAFLDKNKKEAGVIEIEPGKLQYLVVEQGNGPTVASDSKPLIRYVGKYLNGTVFGSSEDVGGSITVPLDQTIPGFSKGIVGMKEGEKRTLFVHPDLGYGTQGQLLPNALLIFDVEVLKANNTQNVRDLEDAEDDEDEDDENDEDEKQKAPAKKA